MRSLITRRKVIPVVVIIGILASACYWYTLILNSGDSEGPNFPSVKSKN